MMTVGFLFWLLMIVWLVVGIYLTGPPPADNRGTWFRPLGGPLLLYVLLFLLGWQVFGWPIKG
jgi:hypothetical protein